jgi:hypothetical protein
VDGLERELAGRAEVLRLNVDDEIGQRAREQFGTGLVPAVILLDGRGNQLHRTEGKLPRRAQIFAALDSLPRR